MSWCPRKADLEAEAAKIKWQAAFHVDQGSSGQARYYEMWGTYLQEQKTLEKLGNELRVTENLHGKKVIPAMELDRLRHENLGQKYKVDKLGKAMEEAKKYADVGRVLLARLGDLGDSLAETGSDQLKPKFAKIEALKAERPHASSNFSPRVESRHLQRLGGQAAPLRRRARPHRHNAGIFLGRRFATSGPVRAAAASETFEVGGSLDMVLDPYPERCAGR